jgi:predicted amidohydrolase
MSRQYHLVTVAGSALFVDHGHLLNVAVTFDQHGRESMRQPKWHPLADERRWGVMPGPIAAPQVFLPWGLSSAVCNDATYYETFRMAQAQGARIIAVPIADPETRYTVGKARRGCFSQVQDVPMVGVVAAATGRLFGLRLTGKAGIYVPSAMSSDGSGVLAESKHPVGESFVSAVVSLSELDRVQREHRAQFLVPPGEFLDALYQFGEDG